MVDGIERPRKQMPQIVWEDFFRVNASKCAQSFHISPDITAVKWFSTARSKHRAAGSTLLTQIGCQQFA